MRLCALLFATLVLAACQSTVNTPGQASAELQPMLDQFVADASEDVGKDLGRDLILIGVMSEGNTAVVDMRARQDFSELLRDYPRGEVKNYLNRAMKNDFCSDPDARAFIDAGGRTVFRISDNAGRNLSTLTFDRC